MDRVARLLDTVTRESSILEIGPSHSPIAAKRDGWRTHVVDHTDQEGLVAKYGPLGVDVAAIEAVDSVWVTAYLHDSVPETLHGGFDALIASHVIEHIPDLVRFLRSAERLCAPDGVVALAIPDPRFCFDYFKPRSTTGDVLEAYVSQRTRHSVRALWNQEAYAITMDQTGAWGQHPIRDPRLMGSFAVAEATLREVLEHPDQPDYRDCHTWAFTPAGFTLTMLELAQLGLVDWHIDRLHGPEGCEMIVHLRRGAKGIADVTAFEARRVELMVEQLRETAVQVAFAGVLLGTPAEESAPPPIVQPAPIVEPRPIVDHVLHERLDLVEHRLSDIERIISRITRAARPILPLWRLLRRT